MAALHMHNNPTPASPGTHFGGAVDNAENRNTAASAISRDLLPPQHRMSTTTASQKASATITDGGRTSVTTGKMKCEDSRTLSTMEALVSPGTPAVIPIKGNAAPTGWTEDAMPTAGFNPCCRCRPNDSAASSPHSRPTMKRNTRDVDVDGEVIIPATLEKRSDSAFASCCRSAAQAIGRVVPAGGHISNIFNFASNTLGIGIISMSSAFNQTGVILSFMLMVICACMVIFSFYLLGKTAELTQYKFSSWELASRNLLFRGADYIVCGVMIFLQFGGMTGYVTGVHELIEPFLDDDSVNPFLRTGNGRRLLTATVWFFGMFTLCVPRRLASLRFASIAGVCFVIYFVFAVVARSSIAGLPYVHEMRLFASGLDAVNGLSLFIFAFLGHGLALRTAQEAVINHNKRRVRAVGAAAAALERPFSAARMLAIDSTCSVTMIGILYFVVGFFGYAYIGPTINGSIFKYFQVRSDAMMCVAYIGILLKICAAYALSNQACRLPIYYCLRQSVDTSPFWLHFTVTCAVCVLSLILGLFIPDISIVFNLLGSICGGTLAFMLPVYYVCFIGGWTVKRVGWFRILMSALNLVGGVVAIVFGTAVTIDGLVKTYG